MRRKLGLLQLDDAEEDQELVTDLLQVMHDTGADFTNTFRRLATFPTPHSQGHPLGTPMYVQVILCVGGLAQAISLVGWQKLAKLFCVFS